MDNAAIMAQQQQLLQQQQQVAQAQAQAAAAVRQHQLAQQQQLAQQPSSAAPQQQPPPQQHMQLQQLAMQQALQQQQQQLLLQQHQQQLAYQQAAQRQAHLAAQQRAAQLQAQMQFRPMQPGSHQVAPHQHAVRPPLQHAAAYPGAYGMMAARPAAVVAPQPAPTAPQKQAHELVLQLGRVKKIVKQASDVKAVANDANFAIARATELFLEAMAAKSAKRTLADQRNLLAYNDVAATVHEWKALDFLADIVPRKIPASVLLRQLQEQQQLQQAKAATNGYAKSEAADVKPEAPVKVEADGNAPVQAETDGVAPVKAEADGNAQATGTSLAEPADQPPFATPRVPSVPDYANGEDVKVEPPKIEQPAAADVPVAPSVGS